MITMRTGGASLMTIRDTLRAQGQSVANILARQAQAGVSP
jgi:hypothetical protein